MNDNNGDPSSPGDDDIRALLNLAGARQEPDEAEKERVKPHAVAAWQSAVANHKRRTRLRRLKPLAVAATLILGIVLIIGIAPTQQANGPIEVAQVISATGGFSVRSATGDIYPGESITAGSLISAADGLLAITLANNASVRFDRQTAATLQPDGEIWLHNGRLYVDNQIPGAALRIVTPRGEVHDIGTQFDVLVRSDALVVAMREGAVEVTAPGIDEVLRASAEQGAGDVITIEDTTVNRSSIATTDPHWDWSSTVAPAFPPGRSNLLELLRWAARESGRKLVMTDPTRMMVKNTTITNVKAFQVDEITTKVPEYCEDATDFRVTDLGHAFEVSRVR